MIYGPRLLFCKRNYYFSKNKSKLEGKFTKQKKGIKRKSREREGRRGRKDGRKNPN